MKSQKIKIHPKRIKAIEASGDEDLLFLDGFDDCIIGIGQKCGSENIVSYSTDLIISKLQINKALTNEDAWEHFEFNILGSYMGDRTPIFITRT